MESRMTKISARGDKKIQLKVIPGHFATPQSHITHYLDLTTMRSRSSEALRVAEALAANYETSIPVDTIICMSGLEVVGAYLAETLTRAGVYSMNSHQTIYITAPEYNNSGQIIFRDNIQPMIKTAARSVVSLQFSVQLLILPDCLFTVFLITGIFQIMVRILLPPVLYVPRNRNWMHW